MPTKSKPKKGYVGAGLIDDPEATGEAQTWSEELEKSKFKPEVRKELLQEFLLPPAMIDELESFFTQYRLQAGFQESSLKPAERLASIDRLDEQVGALVNNLRGGLDMDVVTAIAMANLRHRYAQSES